MHATPRSAPLRVLTFLFRRIAVLALTLVVGVYLAILVINFGGYVDDIFHDRINSTIMYMGLELSGMPAEEKLKLLEETEAALTEAYGLNEPFVLRTVRFLTDGLALDWGESERFSARSGEKSARAVILDRLPNTLLLAGVTNLILFVITIFAALFLSRRYGTFLDRLMAMLAPLSSAPSWIYGAILIAIFAVELSWLPLGGMLDSYPPATRLGYVPIVIKHMVLPVAAIVLSTFFQGVYAWRTFFLIHAQEDYVEMARAKGLPSALLERRYVLRPALPAVLTSFTLMVVGFWQNALALEMIFNWPGIGILFLESLRYVDRSITIGVVITFAYLLALSILILDVIYVLVDPRMQASAPPLRRAMGKQRRWGLFGRGASGATALYVVAPLPSPRLPDPRQWMASLRRLGQGIAALRRSPAAVIGLSLLAGLLALSIYAVVTIPYDEAVVKWRSDGGDWVRYPRNAPPAWINFFRSEDLPLSLSLSSGADPSLKERAELGSGMTDVTLTFAFDYPYTAPPQEIGVFLSAAYAIKQPLISITWQAPGQDERELTSFIMTSAQTYYVSQDQRLARRLGSQLPVASLFAGEDDARAVTPGPYVLRIRGLTFEQDADLDADFVLFGQVYGLAGTDHQRRDLMVALLWGAPVALIFGLTGAVLTTVLSMLIAAAAAWIGGWVDTVVQWLTGINLILPTLPLAMTIYFVYGKSIWLILGTIVVLSIFGSSVKQYRAFFLQSKTAGYLEAAQVYGASHWRIISHYLVPRLMPTLVPQLVLLVPGYIFLEATLALLGVSDIYLPTWGKVLHEALIIGAYRGSYYWMFEPLVLLMTTGFAFALLGFSLERIFNPRLRE